MAAARQIDWAAELLHAATCGESQAQVARGHDWSRSTSHPRSALRALGLDLVRRKDG